MISHPRSAPPPASRFTLWSLAAGFALSNTLCAAPIKVTTAVDATHFTGACTLRDAIQNVTNRDQSGSQKCDGGTGDDLIVVDGVGTITLDPLLGEIEISKDVRLQIHGGNVELNGGSATRIFRINGSGTRVYFVDMAFKDANAMSGGRGGAIFVDGAELVDMINVTFTRNVAQTGGGAVAVDGDGTTLNMLEARFSGNRAIGNENGDLGFGGALDIRGIFEAIVVNSDFSFNEARKGGAVYCESGDDTVMLALSGGVNGKNKGTFEGNTAWAPNADMYGPNGGGAIFNRCPLRVTHQRFIRNIALGKGGAIYHASAGQEAFVQDSVFRENRFLEAGGLDGNGLGGAIAAEGGIEIDRSSFTANVGKHGGALYFRDTKEDSVIVSNSTLLKNVADENGAAMFFQGRVNVGGVWNVTMRGNGGGDSFHFDLPDPGSEVDLKNTIIESTSGTDNCGGDLTTVLAGPSNLQIGNASVDTCIVADPIPFGDPKFGGNAQAMYWPFTSYFPIDPSAAAGYSGEILICKEFMYDQIQQARNVVMCSKGAVEPYGDE